MPPFRDKLLATLRAVRPILEVPGVLVAGSQTPNLLQPDAAATLVVSQDVDVLIPVTAHEAVKDRLASITDLHPSSDEPSVWIPTTSDLLIEVNFIGKDETILDPIDTYEKADDRLPLMVFGPLSLLVFGRFLEVEGMSIPLPRPAGAALEKLVTDRTGEKGDRDLLVVIGLLATMTDEDIVELEGTYRQLPGELRHAIRSNLAIVSLLQARPGMPDPELRRATIAALLDRLVAP